VGTSLAEIDFRGLATSQGCQAVRVERAEMLDDALRSAFAATEPTLVEVVVES
jgi:thiamine pyrophosphate-dependent acetolactate synthase large subunit-like protein